MRSVFMIAGLIALGALGIAAPAAAEVPTAADFAFCNAKASDATDSPSASPRTDVEVPKAPSKKPSAPAEAAATKDPTGKTITDAKDPQLEGMATDRAKDAAYVATYRSCMRQRGF